MDRLSVRPVHDSAFRKTEGLLIKAGCGFYVRDYQHRGYSGVLFLIEGVDFLRHLSPSEQETLYQDTMHAIIFTMQYRLILLTLSAAYLYGQTAQKPLVEFDMMTWAEVKKAIHEEGKTTVLVYNGGTEQR